MKPTLRLVLGLLGLRRPETAVTEHETSLLVGLAHGVRAVVEVGVAEGATSASLLETMAPDGILYLVDPYPARLRVETWLGVSGTERVARRAVRRFGRRAQFVPLTSLEAARGLETVVPPSLIFLDARHDYESVAEDLRSWAPRLETGGVIAVHDAMPCASRPELDAEWGGCLAVSEALASGWTLLSSLESLAVLAPSASSTASKPETS